MNKGWPTAIINGIDHFVAKKLAEAILGKDINVIGVGEGSGLTNLDREIEIRGSWKEVEDVWNYVFDFLGEADLWREAGRRGARLTIIEVNSVKNSLDLTKLEGINWRRIRAGGVYGLEMDRAGGDEAGGWLIGVLRQAVLNQNLTLFEEEKEVRLLAADDLVEAILRASLLSGTEGGDYAVAGEGVSMKELAEVLMDGAKMTRRKVMVRKEGANVPVLEGYGADRERLRWAPERDFREGIKETLQYFFTAADEERRGKRKIYEQRETIKDKGYTINKERIEKMETERGSEEEPMDEVVEEETEEVDGGEVGEEKEDEGMEIKNWGSAKQNFAGEKIKDGEWVKKEEAKKGGWKWWLLILTVGIGGLGYFPCRWLGKGIGVVRATERMIDLARKGNYGELKKQLGVYREDLEKVEKEMETLGVNRWEVFRNYQRGLKTFGKGLAAGEKGVVVLEESQRLNKAIWEGEKVDWKKEIERLKGDVGELSLDLGELRVRLGSEGGWALGKSRGWWQRKERDLEEIGEVLDKSEKLLDIVSDLIGADGGMRRYLVLFQNENELRPGGGFIGSYGLLTWQGGWLKSLEVRDVYEADGQLKGHVEPPEEIKKYLGEAGWKMRDANWKADFPTAARDIEWFMEKETGVKVDGVIGINLAVAREILGAVGEVYIPEFGEKINKDNLYEQAEFYAETKFFPGSGQKASFLGAAGRQLFEEIKRVGGEKQWWLYRGMVEMLEENEMQIAVKNQQTKRVLADLGWDGGVWEGKCGGERCYADYLYIVEANVGVNKANFFLKRNIEEAVEVKERVVERVLRINYENTAKNSNWPGGDYKNYVRIYVPSEIVLDSVGVWDQDGIKRTVAAEEIKMAVAGNKKEIGFLVVVGVGERKVVEIRYASSIDLNKDNKFSYLNYIQRQSGFGETGLVGLVSFPTGWKALQVQPAATMAGEKLLFNVKFDRDIKMGVEIGK